MIERCENENEKYGKGVKSANDEKKSANDEKKSESDERKSDGWSVNGENFPICCGIEKILNAHYEH